MHLTPRDILKHLGFDVPEEGVLINPTDAFLVTEALRLAGATIDVDRIPESDLSGVCVGMNGLVEAMSKAGQIAPVTVPQGEPRPEALAKLRASLHLVLSQTFGRK